MRLVTLEASLVKYIFAGLEREVKEVIVAEMFLLWGDVTASFINFSSSQSSEVKQNIWNG